MTTYDTIDQWVDWGGHTVTVDPIGNSAWIHEGCDATHKQTRERGRQYDAKDVEHIASMLSRDSTPMPRLFLPTFADLDKVPKFPSHNQTGGKDMWRGVHRSVRGAGQLPVISAMIRDGVPEQSKGAIERQVYQNRNVHSMKALSKYGVPDHGLPTFGGR